MKRLLTLVVAAAVVLAAAPPATAGDRGRTVCVIRSRPVAISPSRVIVHSPRQSVQPQVIVRRTLPHHQSARYGNYMTRPFSGGYGYGGYGYGGYGHAGYGHGGFGYGGHGFHVRPNGYVGGLRNLPSNVIQIPPTFGRGHHHHHHGR